jgi:phosphatidate cytidylyltransferase
MFLTRTLTALALLLAVAAALVFLPQWLWALALLPVLFIASSEWAVLSGFGRSGRIVYVLVTLASALTLFLLAGGAAEDAGPAELWTYAASCAFWIAIAPFWLHGLWSVRVPLVLGLVGWIALVPLWLALVNLQAHPYVLLMFMAVVWIADTAAYLSGKRWGRRKLAPRISPGKSWEGVAGAAVAVVIYYAALWLLVPESARVFSAGAGLALFAVLLPLSIEGDLFESWMKRQAGVKDSGALLPGHGGLLDRIDGLTATIPAAALAFYLR